MIGRKTGKIRSTEHPHKYIYSTGTGGLKTPPKEFEFWNLHKHTVGLSEKLRLKRFPITQRLYLVPYLGPSHVRWITHELGQIEKGT